MRPDDIARKMGKKVFMFYSIASIISFAAMCISPIIWIWHSWTYCWYTALSGLIINVIVMNLSKVTMKTMQTQIELSINEHNRDKDKADYQKSLFYKRIETIINSNNNA